MNVDSHQNRSVSVYDTAKTHLPSFAQDSVADRTRTEENLRMAHRFDDLLQVTDDRFFETPDARSINLSHPQGRCESLQHKTSPVSVHPLLDKTNIVETKKRCIPDSIEFVKPSTHELWALLRPHGLPLDTIPEGDSSSSMRSKRSSSAILIHTISRTELRVSKRLQRRCSSAPCFLSSNSETIEEEVFGADNEGRETRSHRGNGKEHFDTNQDGPRTEFWTNLDPNGTRCDRVNVKQVSETWPPRKTPKRTPAASLREIFERLLASGFASYSSDTTGTCRSPSPIESFRPISRSTGNESELVGNQCNVNTHKNASSIDDDTAEYSQSSRAGSILHQVLPPDDECQSAAILALREVLSAHKGNFFPFSKAVKQAVTNRPHDILHTTPRPKSVTQTFSSRQSYGSTVPSLKCMAESLRITSSEESGSHKGNLKVTNRSSVDIPTSSTRSSPRSLGVGNFYWQTTPQSSQNRIEGWPLSPAVDGSGLDLSISDAPHSSSPCFQDPLFPSPLRPLPKRTPNLSLFPACPTQAPHPAAAPVKKWRSVSSHLRFSNTSRSRNGVLHRYDCQHGHRIVSTSSYTGDKIKTSRFHTDGFQMNTPENCWRCSAKDICNKVFHNLSIAHLKEKHNRKVAAPLFIDPCPSIKQYDDAFKHRDSGDANSSERDIKDLLSKTAAKIPRHRRLPSGSSRSTRFMPRPKAFKKTAGNGCSKHKKSESYKNKLMLWVTKKVVLCRNDEISMQSQPCSEGGKSVRPATARAPID